MIQPNELKIGNWVLFCPSGKKRLFKERFVKVIEIRKKTILVDDLGLELELFNESASVSPIPLTPEVLEKCGFEQYTISYYRKKDVYISYANTGLHQYRLRDFKTIIKHLHQLQNLYFALTGEELNYTP